MSEEDRRNAPHIAIRDGRRDTDYVSRRLFVISGLITGLAIALCLASVVWVAFEVNNEQERRILANEQAVKRLESLERPTRDEFQRRIQSAIMACARDRKCRRLFQAISKGAETRERRESAPSRPTRASQRAEERRTSSPGVARPENRRKRPVSQPPSPSAPTDTPDNKAPEDQAGSPPSEPPERREPLINIESAPLPILCDNDLIGMNCR